ncbi:MAG: phenylacetic acid degradation protein [Proteobacteria bacterium]|nr:phenylacetic acid degradation protein [Pseudomonadota bacterium]
MDPLAPLLSSLHADGRPRVWSLVITVFGDLVQHRGGVISTARLGVLLGRIGVEPGALRTALSRLGRDGWVTSERAGRTSLYRLTAEGEGSFAPATARIYAPPQGPVTAWALHVRLTPQGPVAGLVPAGQAPGDADCVVTEDWRRSLLDPAQRVALERLAADLATLGEARLSDPLDAAAARMLLIHRWRRIVLRHAVPAPQLMPEDAPLRDPRAAVAAAYLRLAPVAEGWLDADLGDQAPMRPADARFARRFT